MSEDGRASTDDSDFAAVATVLADDVSNGILRETYDDARSAHDLADALGTSPPTVSRRLETLRDQDLVAAATKPDRDGHHTEVSTASATLEAADASVSRCAVPARPSVETSLYPAHAYVLV